MKRLREQEDINNTFNENNDMTQNMDVYSLPDEIWLQIFKNVSNKYYSNFNFDNYYNGDALIALHLPYKLRLLSKKFCSMIDSNVSKITLTTNLIMLFDDPWDKGVEEEKIDKFLLLCSEFSNLKNIVMQCTPACPKKFKYIFDKMHWSGVRLSVIEMDIDIYEQNRQLIKLFKKNPALASLEILGITSQLPDNIGILFCLPLAEALKEENILTSLTIVGLSKLAKYTLADALKKNTSLVYLNVSQVLSYEFIRDGISKVGNRGREGSPSQLFNMQLDRMREIIKSSKCLKNNTTLKELSIMGDPIDKDILDTIDSVTKSKYTEAIDNLTKRPNFKLNI